MLSGKRSGQDSTGGPSMLPSGRSKGGSSWEMRTQGLPSTQPTLSASAKEHSPAVSQMKEGPEATWLGLLRIPHRTSAKEPREPWAWSPEAVGTRPQLLGWQDHETRSELRPQLTIPPSAQLNNFQLSEGSARKKTRLGPEVGVQTSQKVWQSPTTAK